ncbi:MAG: FAD-binding oxidoreductase, partial [Alphaproteobacteria bacterium]|nr:FAD-binding oxidoreductase [Alphaproteobacteria bacterium]
MAPYLRDWRGLRDGASPVVLRPATVEEAAEAVKIAAAEGLAIVPQGGNTSLVAGAVPDGSGRQIVLSLARLNRIRAVDPIDRTMIAEAGVTLKAAQDAATENGCLFPLSLAAEGSATIGGALATNAGGNTTIRYGNARDLMLGLEAILPDGRIWHGLRRLRKDNTGYALRHLFAGSEGTLGLITAASLRLFPVAVDRAVAFCALRDEDAALALYRRFDARDARLRAFEYMSDRA